MTITSESHSIGIEREIHRFMRLHFQKMHEKSTNIQIHPGQMNVLLCIFEHHGASQKELCEDLNIRPGTLTEILKRLECRGLVERSADCADRRILRVHLTEEGLSVVREAGEASLILEKTYLKNFSLEEKKQLLSYFERMIDNLNEAEQ